MGIDYCLPNSVSCGRCTASVGVYVAFVCTGSTDVAAHGLCVAVLAASLIQRLKQARGETKAMVGLSPIFVSRVSGKLQSPTPPSSVDQSIQRHDLYIEYGISGLVVEYIVAIVRFLADAPCSLKRLCLRRDNATSQGTPGFEPRTC